MQFVLYYKVVKDVVLHSAPKEVHIDFIQFFWQPWVTEVINKVYLSSLGRIQKKQMDMYKSFDQHCKDR